MHIKMHSNQQPEQSHQDSFHILWVSRPHYWPAPVAQWHKSLTVSSDTRLRRSRLNSRHTAAQTVWYGMVRLHYWTCIMYGRITGYTVCHTHSTFFYHIHPAAPMTASRFFQAIHRPIASLLTTGHHFLRFWTFTRGLKIEVPSGCLEET